jgi:hypothetical protein
MITVMPANPNKKLIYIGTFHPRDKTEDNQDYGIDEVEFKKMLIEKPESEVRDHLLSLLRQRRSNGIWAFELGKA